MPEAFFAEAFLAGLYALSHFHHSPGRTIFSVVRALVVITDPPGYDEPFFQVLNNKPYVPLLDILSEVIWL